MPVYANTSVSAVVDTLELAAFARTVTLEASADEIDVTTLNSGGWRQKIPGLRTFTASAEGFQDFATTGVEPVFGVAGLTGLDTFTIAPTSTATAGDVAFIGQGRLAGNTVLSGAVGDAAGFTLNWAGTDVVARGQVLHPSAARTATGSGTALAFTFPTTGQRLYATFHVLSVTGTGSIVFTVQSDDAVGFPSATTRITSQSFTAVGHQLASVAGPITAETHIRLGWTITGFTSVTFVAAAATA
ncbi:MAG: phage tail tube protein [Ilumatobacteraceae bacterium]